MEIKELKRILKTLKENKNLEDDEIIKYIENILKKGV